MRFQLARNLKRLLHRKMLHSIAFGNRKEIKATLLTLQVLWESTDFLFLNEFQRKMHKFP